VTTPVAIALVAHNGCFLVGRRGPDGPLAGFFEFPGGKCNPDESPNACAVRECLEETGLAIEVIRLRRDVLHTYPYGAVHLHFFDCRVVPGHEPNPLQLGFIWVPTAELLDFSFPEPNQALVAELVRELAAGATN
jgi:8-oxo-dGTP diphosphatase